MESGTTPTPTNTGASNASDFQPPTRNPQEVPTNLFQQQGGLQGVTNPQEKLNDQKNARISITSNPAEPGTNQPPQLEANSVGNIGFILIIIAAIVIGFLFRVMQLRSQSIDNPEPVEEPAVVPTPTPVKPKASITKTPKKTKNSKKKKRARK